LIKIIDLQKKYLDLANKVISNNPRKIEKNLWTDNEDGADISSTRFRSEKDEARWVAEETGKILLEDKKPRLLYFIGQIVSQDFLKKN
jgi:DNA helicase-2/ATP-dependent DNA helicase PcrA